MSKPSPDFCNSSDSPVDFRMLSVVGAAFFLLVVAIVATMVFGSPSLALRYASGNYIFAESAEHNEDARVAGERFVVPFSLRNISLSEAKIVGVETGCKCAVVGRGQLPLKISPGESKEISVSIRVPIDAQDTPYSISILVYADCIQNPLVLSVHINKILDKTPSI